MKLLGRRYNYYRRICRCPGDSIAATALRTSFIFSLDLRTINTNASDTYKVIITGATSMIGEGVLFECLQNPIVSEALIVNRTQNIKALIRISRLFFNPKPLKNFGKDRNLFAAVKNFYSHLLIILIIDIFFF